MLMLKIWDYLNYKGHFYLCVQRKTNAFLTRTDAFGRFKRFCRVVKCYNWVSSYAVASLLSADMS